MPLNNCNFNYMVMTRMTTMMMMLLVMMMLMMVVRNKWLFDSRIILDDRAV